MAYSAMTIANAFIEKAKQRGITDLTPMKLQKLVFFAHSWSLVISDKPLIKDKVMAWRYGPVIESLYREFKKYGSGNITKPGTELIRNDAPSSILKAKFAAPSLPASDDHANSIVDAVLDAYGDQSAIVLSSITHQKGSAWEVTREHHNYDERRGYEIPDSVIKETTIRTLNLDD